MYDLVNLSNLSSTAAANSLLNSSLLQPVLTSLAQNTNPVMSREFKHVYDAYATFPSLSTAERLQTSIHHTLTILRKELKTAQKAERTSGSQGYLARLSTSFKHTLESVIGRGSSSDYAELIQKYKEDIATLTQLQKKLADQIIQYQDLRFSTSIAQTLTALEGNSPRSRRLMGNPSSLETVLQFCYPSGNCDLSALYDGVAGFMLQGDGGSDKSSTSVSSAGDVNGDGFGDLLVGAPYADPEGRNNTGKTYVIFGSNQSSVWGFGTSGLSSLMDGMRGFVLQGEAANDNSGTSVSSAGDVNGDGIPDMLVGAPYADPAGRSNAGKTYVVFGTNQTNAWNPGVFNISALMDGIRGFVLQGEIANDCSGTSVSSAGDINGDGFGDLLVGAPYATPGSRSNAGKTYVVFGTNQTNAWGSGVLDVSTVVNGTLGFVLQGGASGDQSGSSVSNAGDINGDGFGDMLVGAPYADPAINRINAGSTYVVFGSGDPATWGSGALNLNTLANGTFGFMLQGEKANDNSGIAVGSAGDVNADGMVDLLVGAPGASLAGGRTQAGKTYVVFGSNDPSTWGSGTLGISTFIGGQRGFVLHGEAPYDKSGSSVSSAGDVNGDGIPDILVGAYNATSTGAGKTYLLWGSSDPNAWGLGSLNVSSLLNSVRGCVLQGEAASDRSATAIGSAGDINGDGAGDIVLGAPYATTTNGSQAGKTYVLFGVSSSSLLFTANNLRLMVGQTVRLNSSMLSLSSDRMNTTSLVVTIQNVSHGSFSVVNASGLPLSNFYVQNISDRVIQFLHDGTSSAPAYRLTASIGNFVSAYSDAQVDFLGYPPTLVTNQLFVNQGFATTLQPTDLSATDLSIAPGDLIFIASNIQHGQFNAYDANNQLVAANVSQFNQQAVLDYRIQFLQDNSLFAPSYAVAVSDSYTTTPATAALITFNHAPILTVNTTVLDQGQATVLRLQNIFATDIETLEEDLIIEVANVTQGYFSYTGNAGFPISVFRQLPLIVGTVQFTQDGSEFVPSFLVRAYDGHIYTPWQSMPLDLNYRPVLQGNISDVHVVQGKSFSFSINPELFADPDGDPLALTAELQGNIPLPVDITFYPPSEFRGKLSGFSNLAIQVQASDLRGLTASTGFILDVHPQKIGFDWIGLAKGVGSFIVTTVFPYFIARYLTARHRYGYPLAQYLRKAANLEYNNFLFYDGEKYKTMIEKFSALLDRDYKDFYSNLTPDEKKSFAMCLAKVLEGEGDLLKLSACFTRFYGCVARFNNGYSQEFQLATEITESKKKYREEKEPIEMDVIEAGKAVKSSNKKTLVVWRFELKMAEIARKAVAKWKREKSPLGRWKWPYDNSTLKKCAACCCYVPHKLIICCTKLIACCCYFPYKFIICCGTKLITCCCPPKLDIPEEEMKGLGDREQSDQLKPLRFFGSERGVGSLENRLEAFEIAIRKDLPWNPIVPDLLEAEDESASSAFAARQGS